MNVNAHPVRSYYSSNRALKRQLLTTATLEPSLENHKETFDDKSSEQITLLVYPAQYKQVYASIAETQNEKFKQLGLTFEDKRVTAGPYNVLLDWALTPENSDFDFSKVFIINYHTYSTPIELLKLLDRKCELLTQLSEPERTKRQKWAKVTIFVKNWTDLLPRDFVNPDLVDGFNKLVEKYSSQFAGIGQIVKMIDGARSQHHVSIFERIPGANLQEKAKPVLEMTSESIAQQLCLYEFELFKDIELKDFLGGAWTKKDKYERCPHLCEFLDHFNAVTNWVVSTIVNEPDVSKRAALIVKFIEVAEIMYKNLNFTGFFEFYSGISSACVSRLSKTIELIPDFKRRMEPLDKAADPTKSYAAYRTQIAMNKTKGYIPFIGVIIQDLTFINEGNPDNTEKGYVNFEKCRMMAKQLLSVRELQLNQHSAFAAMPFFFDFATSIERHKDDAEKALFDLSLQVQPRVSSA